jgi:RNA polymerase sigma-70 factor (ECF subfamily)
MGSTSATLLGRLRDLTDTQAWKAFCDCYMPRLIAWCQNKGLQRADAEDVAQEVLMRVVKYMQTFVYDPKRNFSGWLRAVWHSAWADYLRSLPPGGQGTGDSTVGELLHNIPGGDLTQELEEEFQREVLEEALARVQPRVSSRDWKIFYDLVFDGKSGTEVAEEHGLKVPAVLMVRLRVQNKVSKEMARLEGTDRAERGG